MPQDLGHGRWVKAPEVIQPTPKHGIEHPGDFRQPQIRSIAKVPLSRRLPHVRESLRDDRRRKAHKQLVLPAILCASRSKGIPEEVKLLIRILIK